MTRFVKRSWGWYYTLLDFAHFKIKLLRFRQKGALSLQYHELRHELWLFLSGVGSFKIGPNFTTVSAGDYIFAEKKKEHKYTAALPTWVLEIQYGDECNENDIVRLA